MCLKTLFLKEALSSLEYPLNDLPYSFIKILKISE